MLDDFDSYAKRHPRPSGRPDPGEGCLFRGLMLLAQATNDPLWRDHLARLLAAPDPQAGTQIGAGEAMAGRVVLGLDDGDPQGIWHRMAQDWRRRLAPFGAAVAGVETAHAVADPARATRTTDRMTAPLLVACGLSGSRADLGFDQRAAMITAGLARLGHEGTGWAALALCDSFTLLDEAVYLAGEADAADNAPDHRTARAWIAALAAQAETLETRLRAVLAGLVARQGADGAWAAAPACAEGPERASGRGYGHGAGHGLAGLDRVTQTALHLFILREAERLDIGPADHGADHLAPAIAAAEGWLGHHLAPSAFAAAGPAAVGLRMMAEALHIAARKSAALHAYFDHV